MKLRYVDGAVLIVGLKFNILTSHFLQSLTAGWCESL